MTTSPVVSVTDELIAELERATAHDHCDLPGSVLAALLAEREELKRTVGQLEARLMLADAHKASTVATCMAEVSAIVSKAGDNALDAARYRWLKAQGFATIKPENGEVTLFTVASQHVDAPNLDDAIDAAMQS